MAFPGGGGGGGIRRRPTRRDGVWGTRAGWRGELAPTKPYISEVNSPLLGDGPTLARGARMGRPAVNLGLVFLLVVVLVLFLVLFLVLVFVLALVLLVVLRAEGAEGHNLCQIAHPDLC
jgi:hypothetical protein